MPVISRVADGSVGFEEGRTDDDRSFLGPWVNHLTQAVLWEIMLGPPEEMDARKVRRKSGILRHLVLFPVILHAKC